MLAGEELRELREVLHMRAGTVGDYQFVPFAFNGQPRFADSPRRSERIEPDHRDTVNLPGSLTTESRLLHDFRVLYDSIVRVPPADILARGEHAGDRDDVSHFDRGVGRDGEIVGAVRRGA